jgi:hypothetical protein
MKILLKVRIVGKSKKTSKHGLLHKRNQQKVRAIMCKKLYPLNARQGIFKVIFFLS